MYRHTKKCEWAKALLGLAQLYVMESEAKTIRRLYNDLVDFDKRSLRFQSRLLKPSRGRFARSKGKRSSHAGLDNMKRYFL